MLCLNIHLPNHRLNIIITKRRFPHGKKRIIDHLKEINEIRSGSKISRFFRKLVEHRKAKAFLGGNLTLFAIAASTIAPNSSLANITQIDSPVLSANVIELKTQVSLRVPVNKTVITQKFHALHPGLDLDGVTGDPIYPIMKGEIESVIFDRFNYGNHIVINHGSGVKSLYAHLSLIKVSQGEIVNTDKEIGKMGATGRAFGDHLHLEIIDDGVRVNPLSVLPIK